MEYLRKIHEWLTEKQHSSLRPMKLLQNSVLLVVCVLFFFTIYALAENLNSEPILFFRLGGVLLIGLIIAGLHFAKGVYIGIKHGFHGSQNLIKILLLLAILGAAVYAYQNQNAIKEFAEQRNKKMILDKINPIYLGPELVSKGKGSGNISVNSIASGVGESISEVLKPPSIDEIEQLTYQKVNAIRGSSLRWDAKLSQLARVHSEDMASRNYFDHVNPSGDGPTERAQKMGIQTQVDKGSYIQTGIGENISKTPTGNVIGCGSVYTAEEIAECAAEGWRNSPGHYANIIDRDYTETGMGVGFSGSEYYLTQDFR